MWILLNNAFLSIVAPKANDAAAPAGTLLVRARRAGDIETIFPGFEAHSIDGRDYQFRCFIPREMVGQKIAAHLTAISYTNFKDSVKNRPLHDAYANFWHVMARLQPQSPYSYYSRAKRPAAQRPLDLAEKPAPRKRAPVGMFDKNGNVN